MPLPVTSGGWVVFYVIHKDAQGQFRWYLEADNHRKVATSGEGYHNKKDCESAISLVKNSSSVTVLDTAK